MTSTTGADDVGFVHPALFYRSPKEYLDGLIPFITDGLAAADPVLVAVPGSNLAALSNALGDAAEQVTMADMAEVGRNPGRILGGVLSAFADDHRDRSVRMIGEPIWPTRSDAEYSACVVHEALINAAFDGDCDARKVTVLCPYDATHLDERALADARSTHPILWSVGSTETVSADYAPDEVVDRYNEPLPSSPVAVNYTVRASSDLNGARRFVTRYGQFLGLSSDSIADLRLIASELATNSLQRTDMCRLALWPHNGHLICESRDTGQPDDPLTGRRPMSDDTRNGHGLFVLNAVADLVRTHTTNNGTTMHAYLRLDSSNNDAD